MPPLAPADWVFADARGKMMGGLLGNKGGNADFVHSQELRAGDVWSFRVEAVGGAMRGNKWGGEALCNVGFARVKEVDCGSKALLGVEHGMAIVENGLSLDGKKHYSYRMDDHIPKAPFNVAVRCDPDGNVPQVQFNDNMWRDFAPRREDRDEDEEEEEEEDINEDEEGGYAPEGRARVSLKEGPWFPFLQLDNRDRLVNHCVDRPRPAKGAGMNRSLADGAAASAACDSAGGSAQPPRKKARCAEKAGSE